CTDLFCAQFCEFCLFRLVCILPVPPPRTEKIAGVAESNRLTGADGSIRAAPGWHLCAGSCFPVCDSSHIELSGDFSGWTYANDELFLRLRPGRRITCKRFAKRSFLLRDWEHVFCPPPRRCPKKCFRLW